MEFGDYTGQSKQLEIRRDILSPGQRVLIVVRGTHIPILQNESQILCIFTAQSCTQRVDLKSRGQDIRSCSIQFAPVGSRSSAGQSKQKDAKKAKDAKKKQAKQATRQS